MSAIIAVKTPATIAAMISFGHVRLIPPNTFLIDFVKVFSSTSEVAFMPYALQFAYCVP